MKRSELVRKQFARKIPDTTPKPAAGPRQRTCKACGEKFLPSRPLQVACSPECAKSHAEAIRQKQERKADRERKQAMKSRQDWMKEAQEAFNKFIRERDKDMPCICCGRTESNVDGLNSHGWDSGHFRSVGSAPHLRFNESNAHKQLVYCNRYGAGRVVEYRIGLISRIGLSEVESLEADQTPRKWTVEELKEIRDKYRKKLKEIKNGDGG